VEDKLYQLNICRTLVMVAAYRDTVKRYQPGSVSQGRCSQWDKGWYHIRQRSRLSRQSGATVPNKRCSVYMAKTIFGSQRSNNDLVCARQTLAVYSNLPGSTLRTNQI